MAFLLDSFFVGFLYYLLRVKVWAIFIGEIKANALFLETIIALFTYFLYYFLQESFSGKTIGKSFTNTQVIDEWGKRPSILTTLNRSLLRLIPLTLLSVFWGELWHDKYSGTRVIQDELKT